MVSHEYTSIVSAVISPGSEFETQANVKKVTITADQVRLKGPLKELGLYTVNIHLGHEIEAELKVWVVPTVTEEAPVKPEKPEKSEKK